MIVIIKAGTPQNQIDRLIRWLQSQGVQAHLFAGEYDTTLTLVGQTSRMNIELLAGLEIVREVKWVSQPFQCCSREFRPQDTVISLPGSQVRIGGSFCLIAGPCSVESPEQILGVAKAVQAAGAQILRGGAFKPRTSPYAFQGLGAQGIQMLVEAKRETGLPIITEVMSVNQLPLFEEVDILQIGARNMQNYDLLREVGRLQKPVLLKRGLCATLTELLMSAEYILSEGNQQVMLCERGIRFSAEDMLSTIQSEKEEHGALDIETIRSIDVPSYVSGRSYSHLGEIAKYRKRALDQIIRYIDYLEHIHAPVEYLEQVKVLQKSVSDLTVKTKDLKPFRFRL